MLERYLILWNFGVNGERRGPEKYWYKISEESLIWTILEKNNWPTGRRSHIKFLDIKWIKYVLIFNIYCIQKCIPYILFGLVVIYNAFKWIFTNNLKVPLPTPHRICIHLAHVPSSIGLLDVFNVEVPRPVVVEREGHPWVLGDHIVVNREDCLGVDPYPGHLKKKN